MIILVTGGAGFIGSHTVKALKRAGHTVHVFDSLEHGSRHALPGFTPYSDLFIGDLLRTEDLDKVFSTHRYDAVIHFAAYIEAGESVQLPGKFFSNNTAGSINLFNAMLKHNVHQLVFSSTAAVYGEPKTIPISEDNEKSTTNPYGTSKYLVEQILDDLTKTTPLKATILRYFNACGADPDGELGEYHEPETHLIPLVLQVALGKRESIKLFGTDYPTPDGTAVRDYIHVTDLANAHVLAVEKQAHNQDKLWKFNVGTGSGLSVKQIIETCRQVTGHAIPVIEEPRRAGDPAQLVANAQKIQDELGWRPHYSDAKTIITHAWQWLQKHPNGYEGPK